MTGIAPASPFQTTLGGSFFDVTPAGLGVTQLVAPAANVRGLWLRNVLALANAGQVSLYADTAAPASYTDATKRQLFLAVAAATGAAAMPYPVFLPPGVGLWVAVNVGSERISGTYDLL